MRRSAYPAEAGWKDSEVSKPQAEKVEVRAPQLRRLVLNHYRNGFAGTADECAQSLGLQILTIRPRVSELLKQGLLYRTQDRRRSAGGGTAAVIRARPT